MVRFTVAVLIALSLGARTTYAQDRTPVEPIRSSIQRVWIGPLVAPPPPLPLRPPPSAAYAQPVPHLPKAFKIAVVAIGASMGASAFRSPAGAPVGAYFGFLMTQQ